MNGIMNFSKGAFPIDVKESWYSSLPLILLGFLSLFANAAYAVTVTRTPTVCANVTGIGTVNWNRTGRAITSNNSYSTASVDGTTTRYLQCSSYGFTIPVGAIINGITVNVERRSNSTANGGSQDAAMRIVKGGVIGATDKSSSTIYTTSDVTEAHGSATDLWGLTWLTTDINATNFGAAFAATKLSSVGNSHTISVDVISITVDYTLDVTPPTVTSITRVNANPTGATSVAWTVVFSESVTGVDAADFSLVQAGGLSGATITSVTGSGTTWTVTVNTGSNSGTLGLNLVDNDTIIDVASNMLGGTGLSNGNFTGQVYNVDKFNPLVNTITRAGTDPTNAISVSWTVEFSEAVTGVDAGDFVLVQAGGVSGASITSVTGSGTTWTVTANSGSNSGTLGLNLVDNDSIVDLTGNPLGGAGVGNANLAGQMYTIDKVAPLVISINRLDPNPSTADVVSWSIVFSKSVTGVDISDFVLATSGLSGAYIASLSGSGTTWTLVANTGICTGTCTLGLNLIDDDTIIGPSGIKLGGTGAGNGNFTGQVYDIGSTPPLSAWNMDELLWNGTTNEVLDGYGGSFGTAYNNATTSSGDTGTCRYGVFDGGSITNGGVLLPTFPDLINNLTPPGGFTITAWIRTTNNTLAGQRIFIDDEQNTANGPNVSGYGLSLGDGGTGTLRFYARGSTPMFKDTGNVIANNTWYFVSVVVDFAALQRTIYVYSAGGSLLTSVSDNFTGWGIDDGDASIGAETAASAESPTAFHFRGNLDEVRVYGKVLTQPALATLAIQTRACATAGPHHYELSLPTASINCVTSAVTLTACADAGSPCTNKYTAANGTVATLSATGGTLGATSVTFDATGVANTTLSYPLATDGAAASVTLAAVPAAAANPNQCCPNGISCVNANSCSTTFKTTGFIVSSTAGGAVATIPAQVSGITSSTYYLRAVKTSTTTQACESALSGANTVNLAYECNNPVSCFTTNLMSINGGSATTITRNNNGSAISYTPVNMTFDVNGNAPFTFNYSDVGRVTLYAQKAASGALLTALTGSSNAFVVAPDNFVFSAVTTGLIKAGSSYSATITARNAANTATPNFGKETAPEGVTLTSNLVSPLTGANPAIGNNVIAGSSFVNGVAAVGNLSWGEIGLITMTANLTSASYIASTLSASGTSGDTGRFIPEHFTTVVKYDPVGKVFMPCPLTLTCPASGDLVNGNGFAYSGQPFTVQVTAKNLGGGTTRNYDNALAYSKDVALSAWDAVGGASSNPAGGAMSANTVLASTFSLGVATTSAPVYKLPTATTAPVDIYVRAAESTGGDGVTSLRVASSVEGGVKIVSGRYKISNAYGSELLRLGLTATIQYYNGTSWVKSATDNTTTFNTNLTSASGNLDPLIITGPLSVANISVISAGSATVAAGVRSFTLNKPGVTGVADIRLDAPEYLLTGNNGAALNPSISGRVTFGVYSGNNNLIYQRESY